MSSYDDPPLLVSSNGADEAGIITPSEIRESMQLVRLQIATPLSVLMTIGASLVCALAVKPGMAEISKMYPTLLSPNPILLGGFWAILYTLQIGFCLLLVTARKEETKHLLTHGVGLRFAVGNWLMAAWAVVWCLKWFWIAEALVVINLINFLSIQFTILSHPQSRSRPLDSIFIHAPMTLFFCILFGLDWLHNGFVAMGWLVTEANPYKYTWQACLSLIVVHILLAIWISFRLDVYATIAAIWILLTVLLSRQTKPTALVVTIVVLLVVHPVALMGGLAWQRTKEREGRIRLEEEAEEAQYHGQPREVHVEE